MAKGLVPTRDRLKRAARKLMAERGVDSVTIRMILAEALETNGASLNYYFGSKDDLIRELASDLFTFVDSKWRAGLRTLQAAGRPITVRDLITVIVHTSTLVDVDEERTVLRLAEALTNQRPSLVTSVMRDAKLTAYSEIFAGMVAARSDIPLEIMRQRMVLVTRYLTSIFALYEEAQLERSPTRRRVLGPVYDLGNVIDTAVGMIEAPVVDGHSVAHGHALAMAN